jgi:hypothetical protein
MAKRWQFQCIGTKPIVMHHPGLAWLDDVKNLHAWREEANIHVSVRPRQILAAEPA